MNSSSISPSLCPACGSENASDSRFCRHCGAAMSGDAKSTSSGAAPTGAATQTAPVAIPFTATVPPISRAVNLDSGEELSSPSEIDGRRARQLLERSLFLSERNDLSGAILACRQSIALAPTAPGGYSMLGHLLERTGDITHAVSAYEKAVQLAPNSTLERESLDRLKEKLQGQQGAAMFHFDENELYADTHPEAPADNKGAAEKSVAAASTAPVAAAASETAPAAEEEEHLSSIGVAAPGLPIAYAAPEYTEVATPDVADFHGIGAPHVGPEAKLPPTRSASATPIAPPIEPAPIITDRRDGDRRHVAVPVVRDRRDHLDRRSTPTTSTSATPISAAPIFIPGAMTPERGTGLNHLWVRPSFYGRSLPLVGATVLALGFLTWARSWAVARVPDPVVVTTPTETTIVQSAPAAVDPAQAAPSAPGAPGQAPPPLAPVGSSAPQNGGFPISNRPIGAAAPAPANSAPAPSSAARPAASAPAGNTGSAPRRIAANPGRPARSNPRFPQVIPPAPIPPTRNSAGSNNSSNSGGSLGLPAPVIEAPAPAPPPVSVIPSGNTPPLNPAGASGRGYVRITQGRIGTSAVPQRSSSQAGAEERGAANASRTGQTDRAIERLSAAINSDSSDAGFRFQQRATLFLERGDYSRAADDFQSAISAYNEQIGRGEQVASARAGLRAARSGLNLALAGGRR